MLNSGRIVLPKNDRVFGQLVSLERHVARGGHDVIDHPRDQHDDLANAAMGAAVLAASFGGYTVEMLSKAFSDDDEPDPALTYQEQERQRRHAELMARYGGSVSLGVREYREAAHAAETEPKHIREAFERARVDALQRKHLP
jgi:hypothetical protein